MIAAKLPQKRATVSNGLRKRPQFEQIVNYIAIRTDRQLHRKRSRDDQIPEPYGEAN